MDLPLFELGTSIEHSSHKSTASTGLGAPRMELVTKQGCHLHRVVIARHMCNSSFMEPHPAIIHVEIGTIFTHSAFAMELNACSVSVHEKVLHHRLGPRLQAVTQTLNDLFQVHLLAFIGSRNW
jgi:hypothetical protein